MATRIAINGFGRIGRSIARQLLSAEVDLELVAINDLSSAASLALLLEYDSVHGRAPFRVRAEGDEIIVDEKRRFKVLAEPVPAKLPWKELGVELVVECTGRLRTQKDASAHLEAGAQKVVLSAPGKDIDATICIGVNDSIYEPAKHDIVSNASCTTNCLAAMISVIDERFKIVRGHMITIHSYTGDQSLIDTAHPRDARRGRAAALSMVPTSTGATSAVLEIFPHLAGRLNGASIRVPTPDVSITCLTAQLEDDVTEEEINQAFREAAEGRLKGIVAVEDRPLVSSDFIGDTHSAVLDSALTQVVDGKLIEVQAWYDNEWGYSARLLDLTRMIAQKMT